MLLQLMWSWWRKTDCWYERVTAIVGNISLQVLASACCQKSALAIVCDPIACSKLFWAQFGPIQVQHKVNLFPSDLFLLVKLWLLQVNNLLQMPPAPLKKMLGTPFFLHILTGWYEFTLRNRDPNFFGRWYKESENCFETHIGSTIE